MWGMNKTIGPDSIPQQQDIPAQDGKMEELMKMMNNVMEEIRTTRSEVDTIRQARQQQYPKPQDEFQGQPPQPPTKAKRISEYAEEDLATMDQKSIFQILESGIREDLVEVLKETMKPLNEKLDNVSQTTHTVKAKSDISSIRDERGPDGKVLRPDFDDWKPLMAKLQKTAPGLSIKQLYEFVKLENKDTEEGKRITEKYNPAQLSNPEEDSPSAWNGLAPDLMRKTIDGGDLNLDDAASKALLDAKENMGSIPAPETRVPMM